MSESPTSNVIGGRAPGRLGLGAVPRDTPDPGAALGRGLAAAGREEILLAAQRQAQQDTIIRRGAIFEGKQRIADAQLEAMKATTSGEVESTFESSLGDLSGQWTQEGMSGPNSEIIRQNLTGMVSGVRRKLNLQSHEMLKNEHVASFEQIIEGDIALLSEDPQSYPQALANMHSEAQAMEDTIGPIAAGVLENAAAERLSGQVISTFISRDQYADAKQFIDNNDLLSGEQRLKANQLVQNNWASQMFNRVNEGISAGIPRVDSIEMIDRALAEKFDEGNNVLSGPPRDRMLGVRDALMKLEAKPDNIGANAAAILAHELPLHGTRKEIDAGTDLAFRQFLKSEGLDIAGIDSPDQAAVGLITRAMTKFEKEFQQVPVSMIRAAASKIGSDDLDTAVIGASMMAMHLSLMGSNLNDRHGKGPMKKQIQEAMLVQKLLRRNTDATTWTDEDGVVHGRSLETLDQSNYPITFMTMKEATQEMMNLREGANQQQITQENIKQEALVFDWINAPEQLDFVKNAISEAAADNHVNGAIFGQVKDAFQPDLDPSAVNPRLWNGITRRVAQKFAHQYEFLNDPNRREDLRQEMIGAIIEETMGELYHDQGISLSTKTGKIEYMPVDGILPDVTSRDGFSLGHMPYQYDAIASSFQPFLDNPKYAPHMEEFLKRYNAASERNSALDTVGAPIRVPGSEIANPLSENFSTERQNRNTLRSLTANPDPLLVAKEIMGQVFAEAGITLSPEQFNADLNRMWTGDDAFKDVQFDFHLIADNATGVAHGEGSIPSWAMMLEPRKDITGLNLFGSIPNGMIGVVGDVGSLMPGDRARWSPDYTLGQSPMTTLENTQNITASEAAENKTLGDELLRQRTSGLRRRRSSEAIERIRRQTTIAQPFPSAESIGAGLEASGISPVLRAVLDNAGKVPGAQRAVTQANAAMLKKVWENITHMPQPVIDWVAGLDQSIQDIIGNPVKQREEDRRTIELGAQLREGVFLEDGTKVNLKQITEKFVPKE